MMRPKLIGFSPNRHPPCRPGLSCRALPQSGLWLAIPRGNIVYYDMGLWTAHDGWLYARRTGVAARSLAGGGLGGLGDGGLGAIDDLHVRLGVLQAEYDALKAETATLIGAHPEFSSVSYEEFARRVAALSPGTIVRLTLGQFQQLTNATLISTTGNLVRARALLPLGDAARSRIDKLLTAGKNNLHAYRNLLDGIETANRSADYARRAVGLGVPPAVIIAGIVAGTVLLIAAGVGIYALLAAHHASTVASAEADRMCALDAASGSPCTGARRATYREQVRQHETQSGLVPALQDLFQQAGSAVFWGGMLIVGSLLAYGAWVSAPAAQITRERLRARASR